MKIKKFVFCFICFITVVFMIPDRSMRVYSDDGTSNSNEKTVRLNAKEIYQVTHENVFYLKVYREDGKLKDVGSGFLISDDGKALTAYHVVEGAYRIDAVLDNGSTVSNIQVVKFSKDKDLAVLKLNLQTKNFYQLEKQKVLYGDMVFAIGYPIKNTQLITEGIISAPSALVNGTDRILTSADIESGMSGGPLINEKGNVVGVISGSFRTMNNIHVIVTMEDINNMIKK